MDETVNKQDKAGCRAGVRTLTTIIRAAATTDRPWASRSLTNENLNLEDSEKDEQCMLLRRAAQILPRRNAEVVALGLSGPYNREGEQLPVYIVYARNSDQ